MSPAPAGRYRGLPVVALLLAGCAAANTGVPEAGPSPPDVASPPGPTSVPATPQPLPQVAAGCREAARQAAAGEHKPAVDALAALAGGGSHCEPAVREAVAESQRQLDRADQLVRRGSEQRQAGDLAAARQSYREALLIYPRYYWVEKLLADLPADASGEIAALRQEAARRLASGQPRAALEVLEQAAELGAPGSELAAEVARLRTEIGDASLEHANRAQRLGDLPRAVELTAAAIAAEPDPPVRDRVVDFARQLGLGLFSAGELVQAEALWRAALALDAGNELLRQYLDEVTTRLESLERIKKGG